jgi:hypothetical protein
MMGGVREGEVFEVAKGHVPPLKNRGDYVFGPSIVFVLDLMAYKLQLNEGS